MLDNGDTDRIFKVGTHQVRGLGSFHKSLDHNEYGEVKSEDFDLLVAATRGDGSGFVLVPKGVPTAAALTNPQAGLARDRLTNDPTAYSMPPAPKVLSVTTAAEMTELYWMALLRDKPFDTFATDPDVAAAATEVGAKFQLAVANTADAGQLKTGSDVPGSAAQLAPITPQNLFRLGLPGEDHGPFVSQFFLRNIAYGTQTIDPRQRPYKTGVNYMVEFDQWLHAQKSGRDMNMTGAQPDGQDYSHANENSEDNFEPIPRHISTPRDLARFVNKDALHQAYFNAALLMLSGGAKWNPGNPYSDGGRLKPREAGFGVLGGPHILALVSEVATRALKVVWNQKWQVNLRLRPEAYGGLVHVQKIGAPAGKRPYGLHNWVTLTTAAKRVKMKYGTLLLPMAFTPGSPTHPAYGAGHATVAGACVTVLKAWFQTLKKVGTKEVPVPFIFDATSNVEGLRERANPFGDGVPIATFDTGVGHDPDGKEIGTLTPLLKPAATQLTIEGELNKLAMNVAMGRSMGGVHWRTDNTRSLILGEALAARILADITTDANEKPFFQFRSFARLANGHPKMVRIEHGRVYVDGILVDTNASAL